MSNISNFAEVIESSLDHYIAQCWQWNNFPAFGALIHIEDATKIVFGVVSHIQTGSTDPTRTPYPYQKTEQELLAEQPQIFEFLKTTFTVQVIGYQEKNHNKIYYVLPPTPCKIHAFVTQSSVEIQKHFFNSAEFLHLLFAFSQNIPNLDELLLASVKRLIDQNIFDRTSLDAFCQMFTLLTGNEYRRLKLFLKRVESFTPHA